MATGRGDALLEHTHLVGQRRLVAHRGRHAAEQRGDLGARLGEAEDVVDEEEHVLLLHVAEVLRHGQRGERDAKTRARRLVHLAEDEGGLAEDAGLLHLDHEVVALTGALADTGEHRHTTVVAGDTGDHLLDEHRLADTGTTEEADLATLHVGGQQVDDLDAGLEHLGLGLELVEGRGLAVDAPALLDLEGLALGSRFSTSPVVLNTLPSVTSPTGTVMGPPVSCTAAPRTRPSVGCSEMARTMLSPMCWATSMLMFFFSPESSTSVLSRLYCSGMASTGNSTSTTGPVMRAIRPTPPAGGALVLFGNGGSHELSLPSYLASARALAPPTISLISWVISA